MQNLRYTVFYMKTNILEDFHICISLPLKFVSATFLLVRFVYLKKSTLETRKNIISHWKLFVLEINQILNFQIYKCHNVIRCPSMKHETQSY